jgi:hypothetical protein
MRYQDREWRLLTARLSGVASGYAGRYRRPPITRQQAIAEIHADQLTTRRCSPTPAAELVTFHSAGWWWTGEAAQILLDAGADPDLVCDYVDLWQERRARTVDLGAMAEELSHTVDHTVSRTVTAGEGSPRR